MNETTTTAASPLFLLDIDGVVNAFGAWVPSGKVWWDTKGRMRQNTVAPAHLREEFALGYKLLLNPEHPAWIAEIEARFDTVWATMWQDRAHVFGQIAGFGEGWDYIDFDGMNAGGIKQMTGGGVGNHKDKGIRAVLGDRPGIWVDDDMTPQQIRWSQQRTRAGIPTLFIQPDPKQGMTRRHFDLIMAFADAHADDRMSV